MKTKPQTSFPPNTIVTDHVYLRGMARHGLITYPIDKGHAYVDSESKTLDYRGNKFRITYFDGCFNPYVLFISISE